jgi:hypothetical protein
VKKRDEKKEEKELSKREKLLLNQKQQKWEEKLKKMALTFGEGHTKNNSTSFPNRNEVINSN